MKRRLNLLVIVPCLLPVMLSYGQGDSAPISYQGFLKQDGIRYNGVVDLVFRLYDDNEPPMQVGMDWSINDVVVTDGLFTVELDFGLDAFDGADRWLEVEVEGQILEPLQRITPAPIAHRSLVGEESPWGMFDRTLFYNEGNVGIGTADALAKLHVRGNGSAYGGHAMVVESDGSDSDGIAIVLSDVRTSAENNFVTLLNGNGVVVGRIEGFDAKSDWDDFQPPLPEFGFEFHLGAEFTELAIPSFPIDLPAIGIDPPSIELPCLGGDEVCVDPPVIPPFCFNLPELCFPQPLLDIPGFGVNPPPFSVPGIETGVPIPTDFNPSFEYDLPSKQEVFDLLCWAHEFGNANFSSFDPISLAVNGLKLAATQACRDEGVTYGSKGADYAEWLPKLDPNDEFRFGEVVGVHGGRISRVTEGAEQVMVISRAPIVLGNVPPDEDIDAYEKVGFMGQLPVVMKGRVNLGDYVIPSGMNDGTAIAVSPDDLSIVQASSVVGRAWAESDNDIISFVNIVIGVEMNELSRFVGAHEVAIRGLMEEVSGLRVRLDTIESKPSPASRLEWQNSWVGVLAGLLGLAVLCRRR